LVPHSKLQHPVRIQSDEPASKRTDLTQLQALLASTILSKILEIVTRPAHRVNSEQAATHRREDLQHGAAIAADTGGMEGLLPLGWVQPQPTAVSLKLAWGRTPTRGNLYQTLSFTAFKILHETK